MIVAPQIRFGPTPILHLKMTSRATIALCAFLFVATVSASGAGSQKVVKLVDLLPKANTFDGDLKNFNFLANLLDYTGLTKTVASLRYSTFFVPDDAAFVRGARLFASYKGRDEREAYEAVIRFAEKGLKTVDGTILRGPALLKMVLLYHVVPYPVYKKNIINESYFAPTLNKGAKILFTRSREIVDANFQAPNPYVTKFDVHDKYGNVAHVIANVLIPDVSGSFGA